MTRLMGDATHDAVSALAAIRGELQLVAGYDTGSPSVDWTEADFAQFPGIPHVTIDQAYTGSPNLSATVRDVEYGAWAPGQAVNRTGWNVPRPTIYCTTGETGYNLATALADGWRGDLWLAIDGWQPGNALPSAPGCTIVAVQNNYNNPNYDLSVVLDPTWPAIDPPLQEKSMPLLIKGVSKGYLLDGGKLHQVNGWDQFSLYAAAGIPVVTGPVSATEEAALLADFPAGDPAVTVNVPSVPITFPTLNIAATTITPTP
jgi:hypothetical protein